VTALGLVSSPAMIYIAIYGVRALFGSRTRMDSLVGRNRIMQKTLIYTGVVSIEVYELGCRVLTIAIDRLGWARNLHFPAREC
jgi:hypothetical protein